MNKLKQIKWIYSLVASAFLNMFTSDRMEKKRFIIRLHGKKSATMTDDWFLDFG